MTTLPPLAYLSELEAWLPQSVDNDARAAAVLSAASALVRAYTGQTWETDEVPDEVAAVVVQIAARVWMNPAGLESFTSDNGTRRWGGSGTLGLHLTDAEKDVLSAHVVGGTPDLGTLSLTTGTIANPTIYVPTGPPPSGYPFPWYSTDDPLVQ